MNANDRSIVGLVMVAHAMVHTYELSIPVLVPLWLSQFDVLHLGVTTVPINEATLGALVAVGYGLFGLGALPSGILVDRLDARSLIVGCLFGMGLSFLVLAAAPSPLAIGVALAIWGVAASVYHPSGLSLISRGVKQRGNAFAYHGMAGNVGIAGGPLVTILLLSVLDWRVVVGLLAIPAAVAGLAATRVDIDERAAVDSSDDETGDEPDGGGRAGTDIESLADFVTDTRTLFASAFAIVFAITFFSGLYYRGVLTFLPALLQDMPALPTLEIGNRTIESSRYVYVGLLMVGILGQYVAGKLTERYRPELGLVGGFGALAVVAVLFLPAAALGLPALLAVAALLGFFLFSVQPFYQASVAEYTPAGKRGLSYGFTYLGVFGVGALGAVIAGTLLRYFSPDELFLVLAGLGVGAACLGAYLAVRAPSAR